MSLLSANKAENGCEVQPSVMSFICVIYIQDLGGPDTTLLYINICLHGFGTAGVLGLRGSHSWNSSPTYLL